MNRETDDDETTSVKQNRLGEELTECEDIDIGDSKDEYNVADYVNFIFKYYREREASRCYCHAPLNLNHLF